MDLKHTDKPVPLVPPEESEALSKDLKTCIALVMLGGIVGFLLAGGICLLTHQ